MSHKDTFDLQSRIRSLLAKEFETLSPDAVAGVLSGIVSDLVQLSEAGITSMSEAQESSVDSLPIVIRRLKNDVEMVVNRDSDIANLLDQIINVGAVVIDLEDKPTLNDVLNVRIQFPRLHLDVGTEGRVVAVTPAGAAVELTRLSKEDRAALESVWPDFQDINLAPEVSPTTPEVLPAKPSTALNPARQTGLLGRIATSKTLHALPARASDSVAISTLAAPRRTGSFRRRIDLTDPDDQVLSSTQFGLKALKTREFYGPAIPWFSATGEPDRVERLVDDRIVDILLQLSQDGLTGMIELWSTPDDESAPRKQILFEQGYIVEIAQVPRNAEDELGRMLFRADRITKQQLAMTAAHADEHGTSIERSLLDLDILDPDRIRQAIAGRLTYLIRELANVGEGEVRIYVSNALPAGFLPTPPLRVHMAVETVAFRKFFEYFKSRPLKEREADMSSHLEGYPEIPGEESERVARALTEEAHRQLVETVLTGRTRLQEVMTETGLSHSDTYGVIFALHRMGLVRFDRSFHQTIVRERYRENVTVKYLSVHKASYFEVLNVHWSSYNDAVQKAYSELVLAFNPEEVPQNLENEVRQRVTEIRDRIESAYQVLAERETRHAYRKRIMPEYKLAHAIPLFLKQSELAEKRRNWPEARDAVLRVLEIEPTHKDAGYKLERLDAIIDHRLSPDATDSNF